MAEPNYIWIDIETTGLDATSDVPLEVGLMITDQWGYGIASQSWIVNEVGNPYFQRAVGRGKNHDIVGPMHNKSGLWTDLNKRSGHLYERKFVDQAMCDWLNENDIRFGQLPLAGSSIGSLDRPFVIEHFPEFNQAVSYRNVDISTIKEICRRTNPALYEQLIPLIGSKADLDHRVMSDIDASITEYRVYLEEFLMPDND